MLRGLMGVGAIAVTLAASPARAQTVDDLLGSWSSPGGNVIGVRRDGVATNGYFLRVATANEAIGFAVGQEVLRNMRVDGERVRFDVAVRVEDATSTCPPVFVAFEGKLSGDEVKGQIPNGDFVMLAGGCEYQPGEGTTALTYTRAELGCSGPPPRRVAFRLRTVGERSATVAATSSDPLPKEHPPLRVALETLTGVPIARAEIKWTLARQGMPPVVYVTHTQRQGLRALLGRKGWRHGAPAPRRHTRVTVARVPSFAVGRVPEAE